ncbi:MAG TPA: NUDIX hydrolase [Gemmataceae bacterium]|jgi:8-oxo-dGTP diphosphatase|nr:NUDIX hydrolase [Gemmataceae bacterium]
MPRKKKHCYDFPRPALTVDLVLISKEKRPRVLLIQRQAEPFAGCWALPGGFVDANESLELAARRELREEVGVRITKMEQLHTFGAPGRDPRGWTVSVPFLALVDAGKIRPCAGDDAASVAWHDLSSLPALAFDHAKIIALARKHLTHRRAS